MQLLIKESKYDGLNLESYDYFYFVMQKIEGFEEIHRILYKC